MATKVISMGTSILDIQTFQRRVYRHYRMAGRHTLPWRPPALKLRRGKDTLNPYKILVSEVMLQQTQVSRVIPKYREFLKTFPTIHALAEAPFSKVLAAWSGLGYNRRALLLHKSAKIILKDYNGKIPSSPEELAGLPGIGSATASAICAFAYNQPVVFIETNIRSVFLHYFLTNIRTKHPVRYSHILENVRMSYGGSGNVPRQVRQKIGGKVSDKEILPLVERTLDRKNPREWYRALMDYGVMIKEKYGNPNRASAHYARQTPFKGSNREIRGAIVRALVHKKSMTEKELMEKVGRSTSRVLKQNIDDLAQEGLIGKKGKMIQLSN